MKNPSALALLAVCAISLAACASAAQEMPPEGATTDQILGVTPWQELKLGVSTRVSMYELIVNGEKYDDQYIQIKGFLRYKIENGAVKANAVYADRDSLEYDVIENSIQILDMLPDCYAIRLEELDGEFVLMSGVFRAKPRWHALTPVDHIRLIKLNEETREREKSEILCRDPGLIRRQLPYAPDQE